MEKYKQKRKSVKTKLLKFPFSVLYQKSKTAKKRIFQKTDVYNTNQILRGAIES